MEMGENYKMKKPKNIKIKKELKIISKIQGVRTRNNINWMNILRIAMIHSPKQTKKLLKKINSQDKAISILIKRLANN